MNAPRIENKIVRITREIHRPTGLMVAYSDDLKGLMVFGKTDEDLNQKLPGAIKELLEAMGRKVVSVIPVTHDGWENPSNENIKVEFAEAA